jgi:protein ImuB
MFASIHVPDFSVEAAVRHQPDLRQRAVAVIDGKPPLWTVIGLNANARQAGIEPGMTKLQVEQFFDATMRQRSAAEEASAHAALLDCASAFSPRVEDAAVDTVILDVEGLKHLFGSNTELAANLARHVSALGLAANVAIASNPDAAVCAARGWSGITVMEEGTEAARMKDLPITILPLDTETSETLLRWGIRTFGALARLPAKALSERLGQKGVHLRQLARGCAARPLVPRKESLHFEESLELDYSITLLEPLTFILNRLCDSLFNRLRSRGLAALELHLTLQRERSHEPYLLPLRLPIPARNPRIVTRLLMLELDSRPPGAPVTGIRIEATPSKPRIVQTGLFVPLSPEPEKLELTLARIAAIVGAENVGSPKLKNTWERSQFEMGHFGNCKLRIANCEFGGRDRIALRLFRPVLEASVQVREQIPVRIAFSGLHGTVETARGPWHSSGNWWNRCWSRDEWDVAVSPSPNSQFAIRNSQYLLRLFRDTLTNRWYAEGIYD